MQFCANVDFHFHMLALAFLKAVYPFTVDKIVVSNPVLHIANIL